MMRQIWKNPEKYKEYFKIPGWYTSGDTAYKDEEGYFWFQGRLDDVINTSGERVGPFEVESKLVEHPAVAEAGSSGNRIRCGDKSSKLLSRFGMDMNLPMS